MATLTLKNIPDDLYALLKKRAGLHRRSINSEAILCLEKVIVGERINPEEFLAEARALRKSLPQVYLRQKELEAAIAQGRK